MKINKRNSNAERRILIAMIVDSNVLGRISAKWQDNPFRSKWANIISKWCLTYYSKYNKAPMKDIEDYFESWSEKIKDETMISLVRKFLSSLSDEYEDLKSESNSDYILDSASKYFNQVRMERLVEELESDVSDGQVDKAYNKILGYSKIEMGNGEAIDVLQDDDAIRRAFEKDDNKSLIEFSGDLGKFFGDSLIRGNFISFLGKKNIGKSFWLMTMAYESAVQRNRTAYFEVGDMGERKTIRRFMIRAAKHPHKACDIYYPIRIWYDPKRRRVRREFKLKEFTKPISWRRAKKACDSVLQRKIKSKDSYLRLSCHPNSTLSVAAIESILKDWELHDNFIPSVICIDYADILKMQYHGIEGRDRINETWKQLRSLSQKRHCLLITATQSDANSYNKGTLGMDNFSDDRRKIDSVRGMIGINQTAKEKERGIMRLNWIAFDDGEFHTSKCVHVAGCLALANPAIRSCF